MTYYNDLAERLRGKPPTHSTLDRYEAADAIEELEKINKRMKAAFRVNMLRCFPNMSHEEIDAEIDASILRD